MEGLDEYQDKIKDTEITESNVMTTDSEQAVPKRNQYELAVMLVTALLILAVGGMLAIANVLGNNDKLVESNRALSYTVATQNSFEEVLSQENTRLSVLNADLRVQAQQYLGLYKPKTSQPVCHQWLAVSPENAAAPPQLRGKVTCIF